PQTGRRSRVQPAGAADRAGQADRARAGGRAAHARRGMSAPSPDGRAGSPLSGPRGAPPRPAVPSSLRLYPNPLRQALSGSTWRAVSFLAGYVFVAGWLLFAVAFTATVTAAVFLITLAGIPLLVAASGVLRGCAAAERARLRPVLAGPGPGGGPPGAPPGRLAPRRDPPGG